MSKALLDIQPDIYKHVEKFQFSLFLIACFQGILNASWLSWYLILTIACYMYLSQHMRTLTNYLKCIVFSFGFPLSNHQNIRKQRSYNQTYIHLYTDLIIHKYICDRSLSGDPFHIVNLFLNAKG